ncbi:MAG: glycosyltransferase family 39 protein [Acidobacteria bacterium]|nr:glycosyltransferase family 39 protein [Acidobacteriota bacterium]
MRALTALAFVLATLHLFARLDREMVDVWDESIYATSALEMRASRVWAVTTFHGAPDYFNSKPPLNVWLIVGAFNLFGVGLVPLRLPSAIAAWFTILVVFRWTRQVRGPAAAALAALVLATTYPFLYVHAGRTANTDAPLTLVVTLVFVTLWRARKDGRTALWIGPLGAAALMLKGPGALGFVAPMLMADVAARWRSGPIDRPGLRRVLTGGVLGALPIAAWAIARWRVDGWTFLGRLVAHDIVSRASTGIEGHAEPPHYYLLVLLRHHYDWLTVTVVALAVMPVVARRAWAWLARDGDRHARLLVAGWLAGAVLVPTLVSTRLAWYLTPFYPGAAVLTALAVHEAWRASRAAGRRARASALVALTVAAVLVVEGRLVYRSTVMLDLDRSAQGLLIAHAEAVRGVRVFATSCPYPEAFLARAAGGACVEAADAGAARQAAAAGDLWLDAAIADVPGLVLLGRNRRASLYRVP